MRGLIVVSLLSIFLVGCLVIVKEEIESGEIPSEIREYVKGGEKMKLTSDAFEHNGMIPRKYTCQGQDINPQLAWDDVPEGTKSFALMLDDPDAPMGTWVHWLVKDIPADVIEIKENSVSGTEVENDFGRDSYGGPCPPSGVHRYFFRLVALDVETFDVSDKIDFYEKVERHKIEEAMLMGKYTKG